MASARAQFHAGDLVRWTQGSLGGAPQQFIGEVRELAGTTHAEIIVKESPSPYFPVGATTYIDVRALTMVKSAVEQGVEVKSKKLAISNNFYKKTGKNLPRSVSNMVWAQASLPRNRNHVTGPLKLSNLSKEYYNSFTNPGLKWKRSSNNNPLSRIGNVFNAEESSPNSRAVGGAGSSRKIRKGRKSKSDKGRKNKTRKAKGTRRNGK